MKNEKCNVLVVHNHYQNMGGEDSVVNNEINMLRENGHKVILYERNNNEIKKMNIFRKILVPFTNIFSLKTYREIKKMIVTNNINIVHVHNYNNLISASVFYACRKCKIPVVQTVHNFRILCPNGLFFRNNHICEECPKKGLKCSIKNKCYHDSIIQSFFIAISLKIHRLTKIYKYVNFIFLTEFNKNKFIEYNQKLKVFDENKFYIKPNFISNNVKIDKEYLSKRENQIIYIGRLDESKGVKLLLDFWKNIDYINLVIYGTGPLEEYVKKFIKDNNLKNVFYYGFIENVDAIKAISKSKALILPTQWYEGFPMTIIEAFSVGTPALVSDLGNCSMIVENNVNGFKFSKIDEQLTKAIKKIIYSDKIYITTLNDYIKNYTKEDNYEKLMIIYSNIIK